MAELAWGWHYLMCPPEHFEVSYSINPWMDVAVPVDRDRARDQWERLVGVLTDAGATVEVLPAEPDLPDLVFTANAGLVDGKTFVPARMRHPQRQAETPRVRRWFADRGYTILDLGTDVGVVQEGAGDALPFRGALVGGYRGRSSKAAYTALAARTSWTIHALELPDPRYYHVDVAFCPLDDRRALVAPAALTQAGMQTLQALVPEPLMLTDDEAAAFCINSVVVGDTVVMPACTPRLGRQLDRWGFDAVVVDVGEFRKAGGACRCLTLALDARIRAVEPLAEAVGR